MMDEEAEETSAIEETVCCVEPLFNGKTITVESEKE